MSEVKRFDIYGRKEYHENGALVDADDYLTLQAERDALIDQLSRATTRLKTIQMACGYVGNGSSTTVKIFQDDATGCWHMQSGKKDSYSEHGGLLGVIDAFWNQYTEDDHGELVSRKAPL